MLLRFIAISILVVIALRLLGRLMATVFGPAPDRAPGRPQAGRQRAPAGDKALPRQLEPCLHCGTYFDPQRTTTAARQGERIFCSSGCRDAHALQDACGTNAGEPPSDGPTGGPAS